METDLKTRNGDILSIESFWPLRVMVLVSWVARGLDLSFDNHYIAYDSDNNKVASGFSERNQD